MDYVYWFSSDPAVHSQNLAHNPRINLSLASPDTSNGLKSVSISAKALIAPEEDEKARKLAKQRLGKLPATF